MKKAKFYYRKRDGTLYTSFMKREIDDLIYPKDISTVLPWLKTLDYPFVYTVWEKYRAKYKDNFLGRYISHMRLMSFKNYGFMDTYTFTSQEKLRELTSHKN